LAAGSLLERAVHFTPTTIDQDRSPREALMNGLDRADDRAETREGGAPMNVTPDNRYTRETNVIERDIVQWRTWRT
jgi:hypothetical protein